MYFFAKYHAVCGIAFCTGSSLDYLSQENLFKSGVSFTELEETLLDEEVEERSRKKRHDDIKGWFSYSLQRTASVIIVLYKSAPFIL